MRLIQFAWRAGVGAAVVLGMARAAVAEPAPEPEPSPAGVRFLSTFAGTGRLGFFANARDDLQEERYVSEGAMELDFELVSRLERWAVRSRFLLQADLGTSVADNLPFSPKETAYEINPYVEWTRGRWLARFGWSHACQHLIYKDHEEPWYIAAGSNNVPPDVYWNRLHVGGGSREIRPEVLRRACFGEGAARPRVVWYVEAGGYLRSFPGMDDDSLYGSNDWVADAAADLRWRLFAADRWVLFATSRTQALLDTDDELTARQRVGLEAVFDSRGFGSSVYLAGHVVDEHPRDSKEELVEVGGVFYF